MKGKIVAPDDYKGITAAMVRQTCSNNEECLGYVEQAGAKFYIVAREESGGEMIQQEEISSCMKKADAVNYVQITDTEKVQGKLDDPSEKGNSVKQEDAMQKKCTEAKDDECQGYAQM